MIAVVWPIYKGGHLKAVTWVRGLVDKEAVLNPTTKRGVDSPLDFTNSEWSKVDLVWRWLHRTELQQYRVVWQAVLPPPPPPATPA